MEGIFNHCEPPHHGRLFLRFFLHWFGHRYAQFELLVTLWTLKNQTSAGFVLRFVKKDCLITFWASYSLHNYDFCFCLKGHLVAIKMKGCVKMFDLTQPSSALRLFL
jgi:hypothetical protein